MPKGVYKRKSPKGLRPQAPLPVAEHFAPYEPPSEADQLRLFNKAQADQIKVLKDEAIRYRVVIAKYRLMVDDLI